MTDLALASRGLRPVAVLGQAKPHGVRLRYMAGCRCLQCRMANTNYETTRARARKAGDWNGIVDASASRAHIRKLGRAGVGYKMVAEAASVPSSIVFGIRSGRRLRLRARTERLILAVTTASRGDKAIICAKRTWSYIHALLEEGFTKARLARELGHQRPALQVHKSRVTVRTAARMAALYQRLTT